MMIANVNEKILQGLADALNQMEGTGFSNVHMGTIADFGTQFRGFLATDDSLNMEYQVLSPRSLEIFANLNPVADAISVKTFTHLALLVVKLSDSSDANTSLSIYRQMLKHINGCLDVIEEITA